MVKAVVNDVVTYYPGRHYNEEVDNSVSTAKKFYTMGSTTVAVRTVSGTEDVLNWVLGDHYGAQRSTPGAQRRGQGSASVTANEDGSWNSEIKYTAFGEVRDSSGLTPTEYRYTGQMEAAELGLYFYVARWYDPYLNHFIQADTIVPGAGDAKTYDRYAYVKSNPILYNDPSGHAHDAGGGAASMGDDWWKKREYKLAIIDKYKVSDEGTTTISLSGNASLLDYVGGSIGIVFDKDEYCVVVDSEVGGGIGVGTDLSLTITRSNAPDIRALINDDWGVTSGGSLSIGFVVLGSDIGLSNSKYDGERIQIKEQSWSIGAGFKSAMNIPAVPLEFHAGTQPSIFAGKIRKWR